MKKIVLIFCLLLGFSPLLAQDTYTVNGETLELKIEVNGKLDLLWNIIDGKYRYFLRTENGTIVELINTKGDGRKYLEQYKNTLQELTNSSPADTKKVKLTLSSLANFIDAYNRTTDSSYVTSKSRGLITFRLGVFGGITNSPFVGNPENIKSPLFGGELEVVESDRISRHATFLQIKHVLEQDDFQYSTTELALGYRFRFINAEQFSLYGNVKFATLNFSKTTVTSVDENMMTITQDISETAFDVPFIFGIGADIRVSEHSFITVAYNELFAILLDNQGNFPIDFALGYKFDL